MLPSLTHLRRSLLPLVLVLPTSSCISPRTEIELYYPRQLPTRRIELPAKPRLMQARPSLHVLPFEDLRPWSRVGESRTDWGFHVDVIEPSNSVIDWFSSSLAQTLGKANFRIKDKSAAEVTLEGKLRRLFVAKRFFYEAQLELLLIARCTCHAKILVSKELKLEASLDGELKASHAEALASVIDRAGEVIAGELAHLRSATLHHAPPRPAAAGAEAQAP